MLLIAAWAVLAGATGPAASDDALAALRASRLAVSAPHVPDSAYARAQAGDVVTGLESVEGSKLRKAWGVAVIHQPIEALWAAVNDNRSKVRTTRLSHVELLEGEYCGSERVVFQYLDIRWLTDRWWVVRQQQNDTVARASAGRVRELVWRNLPSHPLSRDAMRWARGGMELPFVEGAWWMQDLGDGRTLLEYFCWSDPGGSVPARLADRFAAGGIVETIRGIEALAQEGPACSIEPWSFEEGPETEPVASP